MKIKWHAKDKDKIWIMKFLKEFEIISWDWQLSDELTDISHLAS